jgi:hypothetical protein
VLLEVLLGGGDELDGYELETVLSVRGDGVEDELGLTRELRSGR